MASIRNRRFSLDWRALPPKLTLVAILMAAPAVPHLTAAQSNAAAPVRGWDVARTAQTLKLTGTVTAIDAAWRAITLEGPQGRRLTVKAGPQVENFGEIKVGDQVNAEYIESSTLELQIGGEVVVHREDVPKATEQPRGEIGRETMIVGEVVNLDPSTQTVTVHGPGRYVELKVRDPERLKLFARGDRVEVVYTEALASAVGPAAKK